MLQYKGYTGSITFDEEASLFHGEVLGLKDVITFQGSAADEIVKAFRESIDDYLDFCQQRGEEPDRSFSGRMVLRLPADLHRQAHIRARAAGLSLNQWIVSRLEKSIRVKM